MSSAVYCRLDTLAAAHPVGGPVQLHPGSSSPCPLGLHTAAGIHYGRAQAVQAARADVLTAAYTAHPERFVRQPPAPPQLPAASWINRPDQKEGAAQ